MVKAKKDCKHEWVLENDWKKKIEKISLGVYITLKDIRILCIKCGAEDKIKKGEHFLN